MKITKSQLKQIIKEEINEVFGLGNKAKRKELPDFLRGRLRIDKPGQPLERMDQYRIEVRNDNNKVVKSFEYRGRTEEDAYKYVKDIKRENPDLGGNEFKILKQKDMPGKGDSIEYEYVGSVY